MRSEKPMMGSEKPLIGSERPLMRSDRPLFGSELGGDVRTYIRTDGKCPLCCTGHHPLRGRCPKGEKGMPGLIGAYALL